MTTHTLVVDGADALLSAVPVEPGAVRSHRLLKASGVRLVGIALDAGQTMKEHVATAPILIRTLTGHVVVRVGGDRIDLREGAVLHIEAHAPHSIEAVGDARILLTVLQGYQSPAVARRRALAAKTQAAARTVSDRVSKHLVLSSSGEESFAIDAVAHRHAEISGALAALSAQLLLAVTSGNRPLFLSAHAALIDWCAQRLRPFLAAEVSILHPPLAEADRGAELIQLLTAEHAQLAQTMETLEWDTAAPAVASATISLRVGVGHHLSTATERLLPAIAASERYNLATLWAHVERATEVFA